MMYRLLIIMLLVFLPALAHALGLGNIQARSALNEPFEARIELLSATRDELDSLNIALADQEAFNRAGIERSYVLAQLKFGLKETESGPDYIRVYSREPIREPFLNFLIEVSWSKGRIFREYTVLLDPPIYAPIEKRPPAVHPEAPALDSIDEDHVVVYDPVYKERVQPTTPVISAPTRPIDYSGGDYGPTVTGDTLWSLARAMRPDSSVSIQQMMFALLRANPDAFINGNINGLKRGEILRMPDLSEMQSLRKEEAFEQTKIQNNAWDAESYPIAETVPTRPEMAAGEVTAIEPVEEAPAEVPVSETPTEVEVVEPVAEGEPELRLVAPDEGLAKEATTDAAMGDADSEALAGELALANESVEALKLENAELGDKLSEAEGLITDLQRYIELKENELNLLQEQVRIAALEAEEAGMPADEMEEAIEEEVDAAEEEATMEEGVTEEEAMEEEAAEEAVDETAAEEVIAEAEVAPSMVDSLLDQVMGIVDILKNNIMLVAGGAAALLLIVFGALFAMRRREKAEVVEIPTADEFPDFEAVGSEGETDIGPAMADAEAITELPESASEPEFNMGEAAEDKTQVVAPAAAVEEEEEEDPMAEVNVFLAYEHFDQAEDFVRQALEKEPDNLEFHSKLLEVFYAAGDKESYEEAARVLHDKVDGQGDYWEMVVAMWKELSPHRELFAEPTGEEAAEVKTATGGGIVDITGDEDQASSTGEEVLDVTAAMDLDEESIGEQVPEAEEEMLDVTAAMNLEEESVEDEDAGGLDFTPAEEVETSDIGAGDSEEVLDITSAEEEAEEDILDVTAAVGLDEEPEEEEEEAAALDFSFGDEAVEEETDADDDLLSLSASSDDVLDLTMDAGDEAAEEASDEILDLTADASAEAEDDSLSLSDSSGDDILDLTADAEDAAQGSELLDDDVLDVSQSSADDLLDVTTSANFEPGAAEEDLLDVTTASSADSATSAGNALLDFEQADAGLELDTGADSDALEASADDVLDITAASEDFAADNGSLDFDVEQPDETAAASDADDLTFDVGLDISSPSTGEIPRDGLDLDLQLDGEAADESDAGGLGFDMDNTVEIPESALQGIEEEPETEGEEAFEIDMESTVQAPSPLSMGDADDQTVLVKRPAETDEQSAEDEIGTQLDLAKAYIELGDTDNAKTILDEVIAQGNDEQKQQAQDLLGQI